MNEELRRAMQAQIEARTALNALAEDASEEDRTAAQRALTEADQAVLTALEDATDPEPVPRELAQRVELRNYFNPYLNGRSVEGAEAELNQGLGLDSDTMVPWAAFDPGVDAEERVDANPPDLADVNYTTASIMRRVFLQTDAAFLGVAMPSVGAGTAVYPVMTSGGEGGMMGANAARDSEAYALTTVNVNPKRASTRYLLNLENRAEVGQELEGVLRADMREQLGVLFDKQVIGGDGTGANVSGILTGLTTPADPDGVLDVATLRGDIIDAVDNRWVPNEASVRLLVACSVYKFARKIWQDTQKTIDGVESVRGLGATIRATKQIPTSSDSGKVKYGIRTARPDGFVAPIWQGVTVIRDPYTKAASGQVALTAHMLFGTAFKRKDGWAQVAFRLEAK